MQLRFSQIHVTILNFVLIAALAIVSAICVRDIIARSVASDSDVPVSTSFEHKGMTGVRTRAYYDRSSSATSSTRLRRRTPRRRRWSKRI